jgi:hypothetical protein
MSLLTMMALSSLAWAATAAEVPWKIGVAEAIWTPASGGGPAVAMRGIGPGQWVSRWHKWDGRVDRAELVVRAAVSLFTDQKIEVVVKGAEKPYTDASGVPHTWYGRCMIAIVDGNRWVMAIRSGISHIAWNTPRKRDTIHILTSNDEGRTWGKLDRWFDGTPIQGMPYEDGESHSEPGLYRMPNGDLVLQFWKVDYMQGTKQMRSTDNGKTWVTDIERIDVAGVAGADGNRAIGTEDWFIDPENPTHVYMAFEYYSFNGKAGCMLTRSTDNGRNYRFLSWIGPLGEMTDPESGATFEPAIEYVGNRTIVAVLRDMTSAGTDPAADRHTWQTVSTDMGKTFAPLVDITPKISGGLPNALWQRARLYKESNPVFQHGNALNFAAGEGRLWGFGIYSSSGGWGPSPHTRRPAVFWSHDNGQSWYGPQLLHGPMFPGTDTGYGDLKRRRDGTFVGVTYYCPPDKLDFADVEQYTFGMQRARIMIEADRDGDGKPDADSGWRELYNGSNMYSLSGLAAGQWRARVNLEAAGAGPARVVQFRVSPK